jgi:hypothetical protein
LAVGSRREVRWVEVREYAGPGSSGVELIQVRDQREVDAVAREYLEGGSMAEGQKEIGNRSDPGLREWHRHGIGNPAEADGVGLYNHVRSKHEKAHP